MNKAIPFQDFWNAYGIKRDRVAAERSWNRLSARDRRAALAGIQAYRSSCQQHGISPMYAQGYLNHRRWEDEPEAEQAETPRPTQDDTGNDMEQW